MMHLKRKNGTSIDKPSKRYLSSNYVYKRNGEEEAMSYDKIRNRLLGLIDMAPENDVDIKPIYETVIESAHPGITTQKIDEITANISQSLASTNIEYSNLAAKILVNNHQKNLKVYFNIDEIDFRNNSNSQSNCNERLQSNCN